MVNSGISIDEIRDLIPNYLAGQTHFIEGLFESVAASDYQPRGADLDIYARATELFQQAQEDIGQPPRILKRYASASCHPLQKAVVTEDTLRF